MHDRRMTRHAADIEEAALRRLNRQLLVEVSWRLREKPTARFLAVCVRHSRLHPVHSKITFSLHRVLASASTWTRERGRDSGSPRFIRKSESSVSSAFALSDTRSAQKPRREKGDPPELLRRQGQPVKRRFWTSSERLGLL